MAPRIALSSEEHRLRSLLLDVSDYIGASTGNSRPQLRFAGGWVRDKLLGIDSHDIDIAVDSMTGLKFAEYIKEFAQRSPKAQTYGDDIVKKITKIAARPEQSKHLETATLDILGLSIDIANLRKEVYDDVSRNPQMEFGTAEEDALRRDSTINALFYNLQDENVEDLTQKGLTDMRDRIIRTPLNPFQTFKDDPLRILRCIRFACRLGYAIEKSAVDAMAIPEISEALRVKITRERIGVEMEKIFKGARVAEALRYIEDAKLYPIIFSNPAWNEPKPVRLAGWRSVYEIFSILLGQTQSGHEQQVREDLQRWLIVAQDEQTMAWVSAAVVPYSPLLFAEQYEPGKKGPKTLPALVVREGLKSDNNARDTIDSAYSRVNELIELKNAIISKDSPSTANRNKRTAPVSREEVGMLFNDWGISWRASILAAMASELMKAEGQGLNSILQQYHIFMKWVIEHDLQEAHSLRPLVDGRRLAQEVGKAPGQWMKSAVRTMLEWQFRNPGVTDPTEGIQEVVARFR